VPEGFPPYPFYALVPCDDETLTLVADGPRPVRYRRFERTGTLVGHGGVVHRYHRHEVAREWIAAMAGVPEEDLALALEKTFFHEWESTETYLAWAGRHLDAHRLRFERLVRRLVKAKALTEEEAKTLRPRLKVEIDDQRKGDVPALPPLPE
jgi:hypothetical protein